MLPIGVQPAPPDAVYGHHSQGVALSQPGVQGVPAPPAVGPRGPGDADILIYARKRHAGGQQLLALGFRVAVRQLADSGAPLSLQLVRIALCLCDSYPNKLKRVNCDPVSQTRVCEPPNKGDSPTGNAPGLTRS